MNEDVRWKQRYNNFLKAYRDLEEAVEYSQSNKLNKLEKQGLIQGFEYTHELSWNLLKDYLTEQGIMGLIGSKDSTRKAFQSGLISNGEVWMDMIRSRNLTSHTYDEVLAQKVVQQIIEVFYPAFSNLALTFSERMQRDEP